MIIADYLENNTGGTWAEAKTSWLRINAYYDLLKTNIISITLQLKLIHQLFRFLFFDAPVLAGPPSAMSPHLLAAVQSRHRAVRYAASDPTVQ